MDTAILREKDEWGRLTKESKVDTPTDYGVSAAEYALTVLLCLFCLNVVDNWIFGLESGYARGCGRNLYGFCVVLYSGDIYVSTF